MAYMRGPSYVWRDDHHVHIWADDGYDGWAEAGWSDGRKHSVPESAAYGEASGVGIRQEIADACVVMRVAELVCGQRMGEVVESAIANFGGNGGCLALQKLAAAIVNALEPIGSEPAAGLARKTRAGQETFAEAIRASGGLREGRAVQHLFDSKFTLEPLDTRSVAVA